MRVQPSPQTLEPLISQMQPPQNGQASTPAAASFTLRRSIIAALSPTSQLNSGDFGVKFKLFFVPFCNFDDRFDCLIQIDLPVHSIISSAFSVTSETSFFMAVLLAVISSLLSALMSAKSVPTSMQPSVSRG